MPLSIIRVKSPSFRAILHVSAPGYPSPFTPATQADSLEGLPGVLGNKGTLAKYRREQGNIGKISKGTREHWRNIEGNKGTLANFWEQGKKIRKITVRKHSENVWEHGNTREILEGNKGTRTPPPPPPGRPSLFSYCLLRS